MKTIYYSSSLNRPGKQKSAALEIHGTTATSPEKGTNHKSFMCQVCNYECEKYITLQKHINTKHQFTNIQIQKTHGASVVIEIPIPCRSSSRWGPKDVRRYEGPKRKVAPRPLEVQEATSTFTTARPQTWYPIPSFTSTSCFQCQIL